VKRKIIYEIIKKMFIPKQTEKRNNSNDRISKSNILVRKRFGDLKLGFFSDSGFRNPDY
jgi:hypothetical protein